MPQAIPGQTSSSPPAANRMAPGFLRVVSPAELDQQDREQLARDAQRNRPPIVEDLSKYIRNRWQMFRNHRNTGNNPMNQRLLRAQRVFEGQYDPDKRTEILKFGGSVVYSRLVGVKCRGATSLLRDVYLSGDRPWSVESQPDPPVPPVIMSAIAQMVAAEAAQQHAQPGAAPPNPDDVHARYVNLVHQAQQTALRQAQGQAQSASNKIDDILMQGQFYDALADFLVDLPLYPFACIKGPVVRMVPKLTWQGSRASLQNVPQMFWERVDPFNLYWDPGCVIFDSAEIIERKKLTRADLNGLIGLPGYNQDAVRGALEDYSRGLRDWLDAPDTEAALLRNRESPFINYSQLLDCIEYHGHIQGRMLLENGVDRNQVPDLDRDYLVESWVVGQYTLKTQISPSPRQRHPYYLTSFEKVPGTVAGHGLTDILEDMQEVANATLRALVNNMCLTGDTVVYRHYGAGNKLNSYARTGKASTTTIAELWELQQSNPKGVRKNKIRSLDVSSGEFIGQNIELVHYNGVKDVYEIKTVAGYTIEATANHRFLDDTGEWRYVANFVVGDLIGVNGAVVPLPRKCYNCDAILKSPSATRCRSCAMRVSKGVMDAEGRRSDAPLHACVDCGIPIRKWRAVRCKSCAAKASGSWNDRQAQAALNNRAVRPTTARARKLVKAQLKSACEECGGVERLHLHHLDLDPWNCAPANLKTLCEPCHKAWHVRHGHYGDPRLHRFLDFDRIESIRHVGRKPTFCLTMRGQPNFVANGFVSRNSIASGPQVVINSELLDPSTNEDNLYPWKRWKILSDPLGSTREPVTFFQPSSNAQELIGIYQAIAGLADDISAIPRYTTGESLKGGAGRTASGLSMLMGNSQKVLQTVAANIDSDVLRGVLDRLYDMIMLTDRSGLLTGNEQIQVNGVIVAMQKETEQQRQLQWLQITMNPLDSQIIGEVGRARVLRAIAQTLGLPDDIVPDDDTVQQQAAQQKQMQMAQMIAESQQGGGGPASPAAQAQGAQGPMPGAIPGPQANTVTQ